MIQDAAQGFHWTNDQATLHPFVVYYAGTKMQSGRGSSVQHDDDTTEKLRCLSFVIISDCLKHDTVAVHHFLKLLLQFLKTVLTVNKVYYFSDGAASQYKNNKTS